MHLLNNFAISAGSKIDKPFILPKYFPLQVDKYITLHTTSKNSKTYDYWKDVISIIQPVLSKMEISIVQIGSKDDRMFPECYNTCGQTTVNQTAYILKNSILHLGVDSFPVHIAGSYGIPIVSLYSNNYIENVKPYFHGLAKFLEPDRKGKKPVFSFDEKPKTINTITPERIARSVFELLGISDEIKTETLWVGNLYHQNRIIESVPNQVVDIRPFKIESLIMRMDYEFNEDVLANQLSLCNCSIVTNRPINTDIVSQFKSNIAHIIYELDEKHSPDFANVCQKLGIEMPLASFLPEETIESFKQFYMDFGIIYNQKNIQQTDIKELEGAKNIYYLSNKTILSNGKCYASRPALALDRPMAGISQTAPEAIYDETLFWRDSQYFRLLSLT